MNAQLSSEEKLAILQTAHSHRKWLSLDDRRVCVLCSQSITGHQIDFTPNGRGGYTLHCPTEGCPSVPDDWFYRGSGSSVATTAGRRIVEMDLWG